jgi:photolyase PhrII
MNPFALSHQQRLCWQTPQGRLPWDAERLPSKKPPFIIYWMRVAVRAHDNPALETALQLAEHYQVPLLVYHAVDERYPYASARHHTFILEGARDVAADFAALGIAYALHLPRVSCLVREVPVLRELAVRSSLVVTELFPLAPLDGWSARLAEAARVVLVDASCLAPMPTSAPEAPERAYRFRRRIDKIVREEVQCLNRDLVVPRCARSDVASFALPFVPVPIITCDDEQIAALVSECAIDHAVQPVRACSGGTRAGYKRWQAFLEYELEHYAATRNHPLMDGTSRMSAYLHYGHVSPFRLMRDLLASRHRDAAEKLMDELATWRELAWHFCYHTPSSETIQALPAWARETLRAHESDARKALPAWLDLAEARSPDAFWNACQRSLLAHGELHNNARMTWGKKLIEWTETAEDALGLMLDLNHRYALDGRDPCSLGGILWCLGAFDAPHAEASIFGTVRRRPTDVHEERLPLPAWRAWVSRSTRERTRPKPEAIVQASRGASASARAVTRWQLDGSSSFQDGREPTVAIIGAGVAGVAAATVLANHNVRVVLYDKGRRLSGRMASRIMCGVPFDYGAQYFTAESPTFERICDSLVWARVLGRWDPRLIANQGDDACDRSLVRYTGSAGNAALLTALAEGLDIRFNRQVQSVRRLSGRDDRRWEVGFSEGPNVYADWVVATAPLPQVRSFIVEQSWPSSIRCELDQQDNVWNLERVNYTRCFSLSFAMPATDVGFDASDEIRGLPISWMSRETSKAGRESTLDVWTVHSTDAFAAQHFDVERSEVERLLLEAAARRLGIASLRPDVKDAFLHRWKFSRASVAAEKPVASSARPRQRIDLSAAYLADGLVLAGDGVGVGLGGASSCVEDAYLSGVRAAAHILNRA